MTQLFPSQLEGDNHILHRTEYYQCEVLPIYLLLPNMGKKPQPAEAQSISYASQIRWSNDHQKAVVFFAEEF